MLGLLPGSNTLRHTFGFDAAAGPFGGDDACADAELLLPNQLPRMPIVVCNPKEAAEQFLVSRSLTRTNTDLLQTCSRDESTGVQAASDLDKLTTKGM